MNWQAGRIEWKLAAKIAARAVAAGIYRDNEFDKAEMDVIACHMSGCPLALDELLAAEQSEFNHDVRGIRGHLDRKTGELGDCFVPRFAESEFQRAEDAS